MNCSLKELLSESAADLLKRRGFGHKALQERYEELREIANLIIKDINYLGISIDVQEQTPDGWKCIGELTPPDKK